MSHDHHQPAHGHGDRKDYPGPFVQGRAVGTAEQQQLLAWVSVQPGLSAGQVNAIVQPKPEVGDYNAVFENLSEPQQRELATHYSPTDNDKTAVAAFAAFKRH